MSPSASNARSLSSASTLWQAGHPAETLTRLYTEEPAMAHIGIDFEPTRSEEHTSELQSLRHLVCRLLLEKKQLESGSITTISDFFIPAPVAARLSYPFKAPMVLPFSKGLFIFFFKINGEPETSTLSPNAVPFA